MFVFFLVNAVSMGGGGGAIQRRKAHIYSMCKAHIYSMCKAPMIEAHTGLFCNTHKSHSDSLKQFSLQKCDIFLSTREQVREQEEQMLKWPIFAILTRGTWLIT